MEGRFMTILNNVHIEFNKKLSVLNHYTSTSVDAHNTPIILFMGW